MRTSGASGRGPDPALSARAVCGVRERRTLRARKDRAPSPAGRPGAAGRMNPTRGEPVSPTLPGVGTKDRGTHRSVRAALIRRRSFAPGANGPESWAEVLSGKARRQRASPRTRRAQFPNAYRGGKQAACRPAPPPVSGPSFAHKRRTPERPQTRRAQRNRSVRLVGRYARMTGRHCFDSRRARRTFGEAPACAVLPAEFGQDFFYAIRPSPTPPHGGDPPLPPVAQHASLSTPVHNDGRPGARVLVPAS